jgi:uncharacterized membrane protein YciS (DUF1049 family)
VNPEVIKQFLISLGFGVDDSDLAKFNKAIASASARVVTLYTAVQGAAAGIFWGISKISEGFEQMGYEYRIIAPAINKAIVLRNELLKAYRAAGINITTVVQQAVKFNMALAKTQFALKAIYTSVAAKFFPLLTKQMDNFTKKLYANMPKIQNGLMKFVNFVFKAFDATTILAGRVWSILERVYDFFKKLHDATDGWSTVVLGLIAAWKLLNLSFLATPLGMVLAGLVAILALYDDFKTFQEGGESFFNWAKYLPVIKSVENALQGVVNVFDMWLEAIAKVIVAFENLFHSNFATKIGQLISGYAGLMDSLGKSIGSGIGSLLGNNIQNNPVGAVNPTPLGSTVSNNSAVNQNVNQKTEININGSADANATGKAVQTQQNRVNFDMARNLKGATR